jgi:hypothetical protein
VTALCTAPVRDVVLRCVCVPSVVERHRDANRPLCCPGRIPVHFTHARIRPLPATGPPPRTLLTTMAAVAGGAIETKRGDSSPVDSVDEWSDPNLVSVPLLQDPHVVAKKKSKKKKSDDGDESLSDLLTFVHGRVADKVRQEAVEAGIFVDTDAAEEEMQLSATQQMKIEARAAKKQSALMGERMKKRNLVTQGWTAATGSMQEEEAPSSGGEDSFASTAVTFASEEEALAEFKKVFQRGQAAAQQTEFAGALQLFKDAFRCLPKKDGKFAGICVGSAAGAELHLGELRMAKTHANQALGILSKLTVKDDKMEAIVQKTLEKTLQELGEKKEVAVSLADLGL